MIQLYKYNIYVHMCQEWRLLCIVATKLVRLTLMMTTIPTSSRHSLSPEESQQLPLHVSELKHVYCWVCSCEETRSAESIERARNCRGLTRSRSNFVHPCNCSLVAHEKVCMVQSSC